MPTMMTPLIRRWTLLCVATVITLFLFFHAGGDRHSVLVLPAFPWSRHGEFPYPIKWKEVPQHFPVSDFIALPTGAPVNIPRIQHDFKPEDHAHEVERLKRRDTVKKAFVHSWKGYTKYAWLHDEVAPVTKGHRDPFGGWGATLVDALDSLLILNMTHDFEIAVKALRKIDFTTTHLEHVNVFETTIRYLGGLLSANDLSGGKYPILMEKALEIGEMLYKAFDTPNRMPLTRWPWKKAVNGREQEASTYTLAAEMGSLTLEFTRLSQVSGDPKYYDAVQRITNVIESGQNRTQLPGLWPIIFNAAIGPIVTHDYTFTLGGMSDSLYEYLPKEYLLLGGLSNQYRVMYENAIDAAKKYLFFRPMTPDNRDVLISGTAKKMVAEPIKLTAEGQHLTCFTGGMVGIGAKIFGRDQDLDVARKLVDGCAWAYESTKTGIMPEIFRAVPCENATDCKWDKSLWYKSVSSSMVTLEGDVPSSLDDRAERLIGQFRLPPGFSEIRDSRYILRPEAIESIFILYRITGDTKYQDTAWRMFNAIHNVTHTGISYAGIEDVTQAWPPKIDSSESFWMAETLKYFYLIFSEPELISLDEYVFNTEAHPLKRPCPGDFCLAPEL
ncbi:class I alpha-mannosidase-like protein [Trichodelitschia bisporula]|uniref:alpha-1,2-Mannosidase n=1 Tax=Trichodelitschia bisporula TaxID=703511 RepID=A0A6G1HY35_9PEZI|nr:class I alpha-mannosidase-like protein [Trichodelitschia bisporula]